MDTVDVAERETRAGHDQHRDGTERQRRETLEDPRRPRPLGRRQRGHQQMGEAADPHRRRQLVERVERHQRRAMARTCRGMARPHAGDDQDERGSDKKDPAQPQP